jgi:RHS repeat-associated protein
MSGYDVDPNSQLASDGTYTYEYDDEGNRTAKENIATGERVEYEWDHRNRLIQVTFKDSLGAVTKTVDQSYDYLNRWVRSSTDPDGAGSATATDRFFIHEDGQIVLEFDGGSASDLTNRYLWGPMVDQILADEQVTSLSAAGNVIWPLTDHLNTTRDLVDRNESTGAVTVTNHREFDSFGNLVSESNAAVDHVFGFTGRYFDEASGLQNNWNRWYDAEIGQWVNEDPIGFGAGDTNLNRYVSNEPILAIDPTGHAEYASREWLRWFYKWKANRSASSSMRPAAFKRHFDAAEKKADQMDKEVTALAACEYKDLEESEARRRAFLDLYSRDRQLEVQRDAQHGTVSPSPGTLEHQLLVQTEWEERWIVAGVSWAERQAYKFFLPSAGSPWQGNLENTLGALGTAAQIKKGVGNAVCGLPRRVSRNPSGLPNSNNEWGRNRIVKELHDRGFHYTGPTTSDGGAMYKNPTTGEEVRIMPKPNRPLFRSETPEKFHSESYYRYRSGSDQPWGPHTTLPDSTD